MGVADTFPRWLHVLQPDPYSNDSVVTEEGHWYGRMHAMRAEVRSLRTDMQKQQAAVSRELEMRMRQMMRARMQPLDDVYGALQRLEDLAELSLARGQTPTPTPRAEGPAAAPLHVLEADDEQEEPIELALPATLARFTSSMTSSALAGSELKERSDRDTSSFSPLSQLRVPGSAGRS